MTHELRFYERRGGERPVKDYLRGQSKAVRGEAGWLLTRLEREGDRLGRPLADYLENGIYESRVVVERNQHRILHFFAGKSIVMTNAFLKKTARVPKPERDKAEKFRADWREREAGR